MFSKRKRIPEETFIAVAALYETLFNKRTVGKKDENSTSILIDTLKDHYLHPEIKERDPNTNIISTFDLIFLIGWKYDESKPKPYKSGSAKFSLKEVVEELNEKENPDDEGEKHKIKHGIIIDDGDNVIEKEK